MRRDGAIVWESDWVEDYGALIPTWGITASPLIDGDRLIALVGAIRTRW
jgi:outer membrane protein assembly factor BamB